MEEFDRDFQYIATKRNLTVLLGHLTEALNDSPKNFRSQAERIEHYFSMLDQSVKLRLYNLYDIDFEMFGYSATDFLWPIYYIVFQPSNWRRKIEKRIGFGSRGSRLFSSNWSKTGFVISYSYSCLWRAHANAKSESATRQCLHSLKRRIYVKFKPRVEADPSP